MENNGQSLETRYRKLAINFSCDICGMPFMATGKDLGLHMHEFCDSYNKSHSITAMCPKCNNYIPAESDIEKAEGAEMVEYILSLPPIYRDED